METVKDNTTWMDENRPMSLKRAAAILGCSDAVFHHERKEGNIKFVKVWSDRSGREIWGITPQDLERVRTDPKRKPGSFGKRRKGSTHAATRRRTDEEISEAKRAGLEKARAAKRAKELRNGKSKGVLLTADVLEAAAALQRAMAATGIQNILVTPEGITL